MTKMMAGTGPVTLTVALAIATAAVVAGVTRRWPLWSRLAWIPWAVLCPQVLVSLWRWGEEDRTGLAVSKETRGRVKGVDERFLALLGETAGQRERSALMEAGFDPRCR